MIEADTPTELEMRAREPLHDQIMRNLKAAMDRVDPDIDQVEFWAAALEAFSQPVPGYEAHETGHLLRSGGGAQTTRTNSFGAPFSGRR